MTIEEIRQLRNANPFRPFELITGNGAVVKIERSFAIALAPNGRSVAGYDPIGRSFYFDLDQLSGLRLAGKRRVNRNGGR